MRKRKFRENFFRFLKLIYLKLFRINDSPQKIAIGFGLGVFLGILPATGPLASLFAAWIFRVNRAAALLGCLLTNTWFAVATFLFSIKAGSVVMGLDWHQVYSSYQQLIKNFHWADLLKLSIFKMFLPVLIGYFIISLLVGLAAYFITIIILTRFKPKLSKRKTSPA
jgi:uncharacterized protein (DUF2062 family)